VVRFSPEELDRRLAAADRARLALRQATRELAELGASALARRRGFSGAPASVAPAGRDSSTEK
jgi:hypothetical protein